MAGKYVPLEVVRPKVIAILQHYGPTEAAADVTGVQNRTIKRIYSRHGAHVEAGIAEKIDTAYKKIPR